MSTDATTETAIGAAERLDALIPRMIHARRMSKLWDDDYGRDRYMAMALLHELGRTKPGDGWETAAGSLQIAVRRGELDYKTAYEALREVVGDSLIILAHDQAGVTAAAAVRSRLTQAMESTPGRRPDSTAYLELSVAREEPDAITRARNAGALEALSQLIALLPATNTAVIDELADEYGGFAETNQGEGD